MTRHSRRAFLAGTAAVGLGTVAFAAARARPRNQRTPTSATPAAPPAVTPVHPTPTPLPRGGAITLAAPGSFDFDTFDPQRSGEPSTVEALGRVHARLLQWADPQTAHLGPDLAAAWEQPGDDLVILHLDPAARWHAQRPLDDAPVYAHEVVAHLSRAVAIAREGTAPIAQRAAPLRDVAGIEALSDHTLRVRLARPSPFLLSALAGEYALVLHPQVAAALDAAADPLDPAHLVGCGPWTFESSTGGALRFRAHHAGHRPPLLDALTVAPPVRVLERYRVGELDEFPTFDGRDAATARALPGIQEFPVHQRDIVLSTFAVDRPPWSDPRLLQAISGALSRSWLADALFAGRADPAGPLPPVYAAAVPPARLEDIPGFGPDPVAEARTARQRWEAAGGPSLETVVVDIPAIFEPRYAASAIVLPRLSSVLGVPFRPSITTYTAIARRIQERSYGNGRAEFWFGWGAPLPSPDPREALVELYGHALQPAELAALSALPPDAHPGLADLQIDLARRWNAGLITWVQQRHEHFRRPGTVGPVPSPFWDGHRDVQRFRT